ncbi:MAG: flagellar hook-associated protein FlgK, partial [Acetobacteraceae bacterium]|nr:flagellar hook-associated protein FlgK [Acetobacteraceae bacterium]
LDEFANGLASRFDAQGLRLFTDPTGAVPASTGAPVQSGYVGFASEIQVNPAVLQQPALVRDGTQAVSGNPAGASSFTPNPPGGPAGFNTLISRVLDYALGSEVQSGVPQPGFNVNRLGATGTISAPFAAPPTLAGFATALVGAQAQQSSATTSTLSMEQSVQTALQSKFTAQSGVNIDTEMSTMLQLQNAYQANARVLTAVQQLFTDLFNAVNP